MFHFHLQTLLHLRLAERDERRAELAKALRAEAVLREEEQKLIEQQADQAAMARKLKSPGAANIDALLETHRYEAVLAGQRRRLTEQIAQVQAETERRRLALVEADRQVRVLEKLRERRAAAWQRQAERKEAKQLDEQAGIGFLRRQEAKA
jgi:flagellar FliJ protein